MGESITNMDAANFKDCTGSHLDYIKTAYEFLIEAYQELINDIQTLQNLTRNKIKENFEYSYDSKHKRLNNPVDISIYHLFFDFT